MKTLKPDIINQNDFLDTYKAIGSSKIQKQTEGIKTHREVFAYGRVSTENQNLEIQVDKFRLLDIPERNIFLDKKSGKDLDRPGLTQLLNKLRKGDKVVFYDLTRLGRNLKDLINLVDHFNDIGVHIQDLTNPAINSESIRTTEGEFIFLIFGLLAQFGRRLSNDKVVDGINRAKANGVQLGRPKGLSDKLKKIAPAVVMMHKNPTTTLEDICSTFQISKGSIYKIFSHEGYDYKAYHKNHNNTNAKK